MALMLTGAGSSAADTAPSSPGFLLLDDGVSYLLLDDGVSKLLL